MPWDIFNISECGLARMARLRVRVRKTPASVPTLATAVGTLVEADCEAASGQTAHSWPDRQPQSRIRRWALLCRDRGEAVPASSSSPAVPVSDALPEHSSNEQAGGAQPQPVPPWSSPFAATNLRLADQHESETDPDDDEPLVREVARVEVWLSCHCSILVRSIPHRLSAAKLAHVVQHATFTQWAG